MNDNEIKENIKIKTIHKSKKKTIIVAIGICFIMSSAFAISYNKLKKNQPDNTNKPIQEENTKIENVAPKTFDKLPEITPIEQTSSSLDIENNMPNLDIQSSQIQDTKQSTKEALLNSELCDECGNNSNHTSNATNENNPIALKANYANDSQADNFNELDIAKLQTSKASTIKNPEYIIAKGSF